MSDLNLKIKIAGDSSQAEQSVGRVDKALRGLESTGSSINNVLTGLGVGISVAGLAAFVKEGINAADALNDLADRSGIAIEKLAGLEYAVKIGDTSIEAFVASANKLSINIAKNADDFAKLGITAKDPVEAFKQLADVFSGIDDPQKRAAFGAAALGKSYAEMAPLLAMGASGIQELIDKGRQHNPVTAEQAKLAGDFNDKLTELSNQSIGFRSKFAMFVLEPLATLAESLDKDIQKFGLLEGAWRGFLDGYQNFAIPGAGGGLSDELDQINRKIAEQKQLLSEVRRGERSGGAAREIAEQRELNQLIQQRADIEQKLSESRRKKSTLDDEMKMGEANLKAVESFIQKGNSAADEAAKAAESAAKSLQSAYESTERSLRKEIALRGENSAAAQMEFEVQFGSLAKLDESRKLVLLNLAAEKDAVLANVQAYKEYDDIVEQGLALAGKQRAAQSENYQRLFDRFNPGYSTLSQGIADVDQAKALGLIDADRAKAEFDKLGKDYNDLVNKVNDGSDEMSQFAIQAARNIQTSFADFIMSAGEGFDELGANFAKTLARMAADAASAQLMDTLLGKGFGTANAAGNGLLQAGFSAVSSFFGFADGGIMTAAGPLPLRTYAGGGVARSPQLALFGEGSMPEAYVPLPDGRSIPVTMAGGGSGGVTVNIINNSGAEVQTTERETPSGKILEVLIDKRINKWAADAKRQGGILV
ncbi:hypothetical protein PL263_10325 [Methylomonas sp. EFPC3]|uniref:hypothetical protein n=1 Tax=Methylomonas sp. EFPC3 TaxID=3021710 RepID=UPI002416DFBC|nr:hypothetical protein [Methylomonas sp. EFPC3]WFP48508.1 hypothetical protein PL263_10325 [Methylomonas sp. EFPC3]